MAQLIRSGEFTHAHALFAEKELAVLHDHEIEVTRQMNEVNSL